LFFRLTLIPDALDVFEQNLLAVALSQSEIVERAIIRLAGRKGIDKS